MHGHQTVEVTQLIKEWPTGFKLGPTNFVAKAGETVAVFGRNGSGKSTFFQLLSGSLDRTAGEIRILNSLMSPDAVEVRRKVGYLPQESSLPDWTTPLEILSYTASLRGLDNPQSLVNEQLQTWDAINWQNRPLCKASHGMQRRIGLAVALLHDPDLLILDEPFNALDIVNARTLEMIIQDREKRDKTTLISIHTPLLAASICPRAILIENGKIEELDKWQSSTLEERVSILDHRFFGISK